MQKLITSSGIRFDIEWAAPASVTENIVFLAKVINSDIDTVHNTFKNPSETETLSTVVMDGESEMPLATYVGYTRYFGFTIDNDGAILVQLKKNIGA